MYMRPQVIEALIRRRPRGASPRFLTATSML